MRLAALRSDPDAFGSSYEREVGRSSNEWEERATEWAAGYEQCVFLAEDDGGPVGMAGAYTPGEDPSVRHLWGMWVATGARGIGIGSGLVDAVIAWGARGGAEGIRLWVAEGNDAARRLYRRHGFTETGRSKPLPSDPSRTETLMRLRLDRNSVPERLEACGDVEDDRHTARSIQEGTDG